MKYIYIYILLLLFADAYAQQPWIPTQDPNQLPQLAQQPPPVAAPTAIPPPQIVQQPTVNEPPPVSIESSSKHDGMYSISFSIFMY